MLRTSRHGASAPRHPNPIAHASRRLPASALAVALLAAALGGCASSQSTVSTPFSGSSSAKAPMFPESKWGVSASHRIAGPNDRIPKGGGIYKVGSPYQVGGRWYEPREQPDYDRVGIASWYGSDFHGRKTANGEIFDMHALTAAHPTLPIPSYAYVTNLANGRTIMVRVNDRGPYVGERMIDLSQASAKTLGLIGSGTGRVRVRYAGPAPMDGNDARERQHLAGQPWSAGERTQIAAVERAVSAHEWANHEERQVNRNWQPQSRPRFAENRSDWSEAPRYDAPRYEAPRHEPQRREPPRSYADAGNAGGPWSPYSYRSSLAGR